MMYLHTTDTIFLGKHKQLSDFCALA